MATYKIQTATFTRSNDKGLSLIQKYQAFVDSQKVHSVAWWLGSLLLQGCLLVPLTFLLVYSLNGPTAPFLFVSMMCFFINVVFNMGGAGFRLTFNSFILSIVIHALMISMAVFNYFYIVF